MKYAMPIAFIVLALCFGGYVVVDKAADSIERIQNDYQRDGLFVTLVRFLREPRDRKQEQQSPSPQPVMAIYSPPVSERLLDEGETLNHSEGW